VTWTGATGVSLFTSAVISWLLLRSLPAPVLSFLIGAGGGGMLYLTVTDLVPAAQERQYQQSGALAAALGVATSFAISRAL
jgi:ZIP family zinc transporter